MMPKHPRFDLVIFDWAGTMVDHGCLAPLAALLEAFLRRGVMLTDAQARRDMGIAKIDHVRALLADPVVADLWRIARGAAPVEGDVDAVMRDLDPLMCEQAARAATLIDGALAAFQSLRTARIRVASSTGYTRKMMLPVLEAAAAQGYVPEHLVCSGETPAGRPTPLMIYKACAELGVWPLSRVVKVDDTETGVAEGRAAGCFTVGVAASGNCVGLSAAALHALPARERATLIAGAQRRLRSAGADVVIEGVAQMMTVM